MKILAHIGWCRKENHDKVWGIIHLGGTNWVTFWGRRGSKLQTKMLQCSIWGAYELFQTKRKKGYVEIEENELEQVYPEFRQDLEKTAIWAMLSA